MSVKKRILHRRDSTLNWETVNPILDKGEFGVEEIGNDKLKIKLGNGVSSWDLLPYINDEDLEQVIESLTLLINNLAGSGRTTETVKQNSTDLSNHINDNIPHGSTSDATPDTIILRNSLGRAKVSPPNAIDDIARLDTVNNAISSLVNSAPQVLDTLNEIAIALGNDPNFSTTMINALANKLAISDFNVHLLDYVKQIPYAVTSGSDNNYSINLNPAPISYVDGMAVAVKININSTGSSTLNVNNLGAKTIKDSLGNDIISDGLKQDIIYSLRYNLTNQTFIVQGKGGGGTANADDLYIGTTATNDSGLIIGTNKYKIGAFIDMGNLQQNIREIWSLTDGNYARSIAIDSSGNVYVGYYDVIGNKTVRKLNSSGEEIWSLTDGNYARSIAIDSSGNVYVGYYDVIGNKTVRKLNSSGEEIWSLTDGNYARSIAIDSSGNVYVGYYDVIGNKTVRKLNSSGEEIWSLTDSSFATSIAIDSSENVYVAYDGNITGSDKSVRKLNSSGGEIWSLTDVNHAQSIAIDSSGNVYVGYYENSSGKQVRKLNSSGGEIWSLTDIGEVNHIQVDSSGNIYVGYSEMEGNKIVCKLNSSGVEIWSLTDGNYARSIAVDSSENIYVAYSVSASNKNIRKLFYGYQIIS